MKDVKEIVTSLVAIALKDEVTDDDISVMRRLFLDGGTDEQTRTLLLESGIGSVDDQSGFATRVLDQYKREGRRNDETISEVLENEDSLYAGLNVTEAEG